MDYIITKGQTYPDRYGTGSRPFPAAPAIPSGGVAGSNL